MADTPAYDATYAFTHQLRTAQLATKPGQKFDATVAAVAIVKAAQAGIALPTVVPAAVLGPSKAPIPVHTFQVEQQKGKDTKR